MARLYKKKEKKDTLSIRSQKHLQPAISYSTNTTRSFVIKAKRKAWQNFLSQRSYFNHRALMKVFEN